MIVFVGCFKREPKFDQYLGWTDLQVTQKFGRPKRERVGSSADLLKGELAYSVRQRVPPNSSVKEIYFASDSRERIFWFTSASNVWKVVADVDIPSGVVF